MATISTVFVVDDDPDALDSVCTLVRTMGLAAAAFASAEEFLESYDPSRPGCLVADQRMTGISGLELQRELVRRGIDMPIIIVSGYVNVTHAVEAMKAGAVTVLRKPYQNQELAEAIQHALQRDVKIRVDKAHHGEILGRYRKLTPQERQVLDLVAVGHPNKTVARKLEVSLRAVEDRRSRIMRKLEVHSFAELMEVVLDIRNIQDRDP